MKELVAKGLRGGVGAEGHESKNVSRPTSEGSVGGNNRMDADSLVLMLAWVLDDHVPSPRREMHPLHLQRATVLRCVRLEELQHVVAGVVLSRNHVLFSTSQRM